MNYDHLGTFHTFRTEDTCVLTTGFTSKRGINECAAKGQTRYEPRKDSSSNTANHLHPISHGHPYPRCRGAHIAIIDRRSRIVTDIFLLS